MHDVHDEHGLLVYASDYLIFNILFVFLVECKEQVRRVLVPFFVAGGNKLLSETIAKERRT